MKIGNREAFGDSVLEPLDLDFDFSVDDGLEVATARPQLDVVSWDNEIKG